MKQSGKKSNKIKQPDYILFIVCVSLVLFVFGVIGWLILSAKQVEHSFRENVEMHVYLMEGANYEQERDGLITQLERLQAVKKVVYRDKNYAMQEWLKLGGEDFMSVTKENILPESLTLFFKGNYVVADEITAIKNILDKNSIVADVQYPFEIFEQFGLLKKVTFYLSLLGFLLLVIAIVILSYLIKLIVYNNRFLIRTMTLVGASRQFISAPFERRAVVNGLLSALIGVLSVWAALKLAIRKIPDMALIYSPVNFVLIAALMFVLGIFISWISTYLTVRRYLNASALEKFY